MKWKPLLLVVGPTGSGKTALGIELCTQLNGEIISADSMQIYRGCDIGSAKATPKEQERARHHLIDIRNPDQEYSAAQWASDAQAAIADILARGKFPVIVGGTGFYIRALLQPSTLAPVSSNPQLRAQLEEEAKNFGAQALHLKLAQYDPEAAARLHPNDVYRVVRALVVAICGPQSTQAEGNEETEPIEYSAFGLELPRAWLYERLNQRVDEMLAAGFMSELQDLAKQYPADAPALRSLGYKHLRPALSQPELFDAGVELWKRDTRRYAKRQMTWFRHQLPVRWLEVESQSTPALLADQILRDY